MLSLLLDDSFLTSYTDEKKRIIPFVCVCVRLSGFGMSNVKSMIIVTPFGVHSPWFVYASFVTIFRNKNACSTHVFLMILIRLFYTIHFFLRIFLRIKWPNLSLDRSASVTRHIEPKHLHTQYVGRSYKLQRLTITTETTTQKSSISVPGANVKKKRNKSYQGKEQHTHYLSVLLSFRMTIRITESHAPLQIAKLYRISWLITSMWHLRRTQSKCQQPTPSSIFICNSANTSEEASPKLKN